jgi:hypothetical protein
MIEEKEYVVRITLSTVVGFSPIERETPITTSDAIENAYGMLPDGYFKAAEDEGFTIEATAESLFRTKP